MTAIACPYCGTMVNTKLKFCVSCGRSIGPEAVRKSGGLKFQPKGVATKRLDEDESVGEQSFDRSRKSYRVQRNIRQILLNVSYVLLVILAYYVIVKVFFKDTFDTGLNRILNPTSNLSMPARPNE